MSTNCVRCVVNERDGVDLLCETCRQGAADERAILTEADPTRLDFLDALVVDDVRVVLTDAGGSLLQLIVHKGEKEVCNCAYPDIRTALDAAFKKLERPGL